VGETHQGSQSEIDVFITSSRLSCTGGFSGEVTQGKNVDEWLARIIKERLELEEDAFGRARREMSLRNGA
jgi:hypothetical protein